MVTASLTDQFLGMSSPKIVTRAAIYRSVQALVSRGRCSREITRLLTPKIASGCDLFCGRRRAKPCDFCNGIVASLLAATVVTAILRCEPFTGVSGSSGPEIATSKTALNNLKMGHFAAFCCFSGVFSGPSSCRMDFLTPLFTTCVDFAGILS